MAKEQTASEMGVSAQAEALAQVEPARSQARPSVLSVRRRALLVRAASLVVVLASWEIYGRSVNPILFTYPTAILHAFVQLLVTGELVGYTAQSLQVFVYGVVLATVVGIPLAVAMARWRSIEWALDTYVNALYSTPIVALVPLLVLWFGFDVTAKTVVVFLFAVFPVLINTYQGVKSVDPGLMEVAHSFCSGEAELWRDLIIPSALPFIVAGMRLAIGRGLVGMIIAEFYTSISGMGYMIVRYANAFETDKLFVPIIVLMVLGVVLTESLKWVESRLAPWSKRAAE